MRVTWLVILALLTGCAAPIQPGSEPPSRAVIERIFETFNACNTEALVANFSDENLMFFTASTATALTSRVELRKYFSFLDTQPCSSPKSAKHANVTLKVQALGSAAAIVHAYTTINYQEEGKEISYPLYFTFVLQEVSGKWLVVSLTAQPVRRE